MSYLYLRNNSPLERFTRIEIAADGGDDLTLEMGKAYDLSTTELARARVYVEMISSTEPPSDAGGSTPSGGSGSIVITEKGDPAVDPSSKPDGTIWFEVT